MSLNTFSPMGFGLHGLQGASSPLSGIQQALQGLQQGIQGLQQLLAPLDKLLKDPLGSALSAAGQGVAQALGGGLGGGLGQGPGSPLGAQGVGAPGQALSGLMQGLNQAIQGLTQALGGPGQMLGHALGGSGQMMDQALGGLTQGLGSPGAAASQSPAAEFYANQNAAYAPARPTATGAVAPPAKPDVQAPAATGDVSAASGKAPAGMPAELWNHCVEAGKKTGVDPFVLAAQMEKESQFGKALAGSPSAGDGLMQVEPSTRQAYAGKFQEKMGHAYDHNNPKDQVAMAGVILADKGGDTTNMLQKYNGGDNWTPGTTDSYGREIKANEYAASVSAKAQAMRSSVG